jgi:pimeloyl-ACP methyl ester carboxylesterase
MATITHRTVDTNGISLHLAEAGEGPVVLTCHGFPESWYSWRHQLTALADAGYRAVAPDMRGYGQSDAPDAVDQYSLFHLVGDMVGVLDAIGAPTATIVGHDWGAPVAWHSALLRPDRFTKVVGLSVPYTPRSTTRPSDGMPRTDDALFYQDYFQAPGVAEAELDRDPLTSVRRILHSASGDAPAPADAGTPNGVGMVPRNGGFLDLMPEPEGPSTWLTDDDVAYFGAELGRRGFRGGLNWYRNIDRNWELLAPFQGAVVGVPALYMAGTRDLVVAFPMMDRLIANLKLFVPQLRDTVMLEGCGHWTQQERRAEVNAALIDFLRS